MGILHLITGDIIKNSSGKDAIVNSQNMYMSYGSGVCGAIYNACGRLEMEQYCKNTWTWNMIENEVRITPGFKLGIDVIHILAPKEYEKKEQSLNALLDCYESLFKSILDRGYKKVILASLGTGVHGYKHNNISKPLVILLNNF